MLRIVSFVLLIAAAFPVLSSCAQESTPHMFCVLTHIVIPGKANIHDECIKGIVKCHREHGFKYPFYSFNSESLKMYAVIMIDSIGDMDGVFGEIGRVGEAAGAEWERYGEMEVQSLASYGMSAYVSRPDLSYRPSTSRLSHSEAGFRRWTIYSVKYGSEAFFEEKMKALAALYKKKGLNDPFSVSVSFIDKEMPVYIVEQCGLSKSDFYAHHDKNMDVLGAESKTLFDSLMPHIRKIETEHVTFMPELSLPKQ